MFSFIYVWFRTIFCDPCHQPKIQLSNTIPAKGIDVLMSNLKCLEHVV